MVIEPGSETDADLAVDLLFGLIFDACRVRWERELREERGEAWWREHERYLDAQWAILVECVF